MPTAPNRMLVDDIWYEPGDEYPDLGSIICSEYTKLKRTYQALSADTDKLPTVEKYPQYKNHLGAGSTCLMLDTSEVLAYHPLTDSWYKL